MPLGVTHILFPILIMAIIRDFFLKAKTKARFPLHYVLIAGLGGVLPDIDIVFSMILRFLGADSWWIHKTFTHSIFFPLMFLALFFIFLAAGPRARISRIGRHKMKLSMICLMLVFGISTHLALDAILGGQAYFFYPFSDISYGLNLVSYLPFDEFIILATLDGILVVLWIAYLELKHKISDFI